MKWFRKLERKFGRFAIPNLMYFLLTCYVIGLLINWYGNWQGYDYFNAFLSLDAKMILSGQVWRLVTFLLDPPSTSLIFAALILWMYFQLGQVLEHVWGSFRFNVYIFSGIILNIIGCFVAYLVFHQRIVIGMSYINLSLFLAYAVTFPDNVFRLFFLIPIKAKYFAIFDAVLYIGLFCFSIFTRNYGMAAGLFLSMLNFIVFFFVTRDWSKRSPKTMKRRKEFKKQVRLGNMKRGNHCCSVCNITDIDAPDMTFRYCSKCEGNHEYCSEHLYTHIHVTKDESSYTS